MKVARQQGLGRVKDPPKQREKEAARSHVDSCGFTTICTKMYVCTHMPAHPYAHLCLWGGGEQCRVFRRWDASDYTQASKRVFWLRRPSHSDWSHSSVLHGGEQSSTWLWNQRIQCGSWSPEVAPTIPPLSVGLCSSSHQEVDLIFPLNLGLTCDFFYQYHVVKVIFWGFQARASRTLEVSYFSLSKHLFFVCCKGPAAMVGDAHVAWRGHMNCDSLMDSFS